jgi:hypothetical protein
MQTGSPRASQIADYNLANDTRDVFFHFFKCEKILEIIDKNYKEIGNSMCTSQQTFYYSAGMFVLTLKFVKPSVNYFVVYKAGKRQTKTKLFSCQRPGWDHDGRIRI